MLESSIYWSTLLLITTIIEFSVFRFILGNISKQIKSKKIVNLCVAGAIFISVYMTSNNFMSDFKIIILIFMTFALYKFNYETSIGKSIVVSVIFWLMITGIDLMGSSIVVILNSIDNMNLLLEDNAYRLEFIILTKSILLLIIPIVKGIKLSFEISKKEYFLVSIPIFTNLLVVGVIIYFLFDESVTVNYNIRIMILIISIILLISNISIIFIISKIVKANELRHVNKLMKVKIGFQQKYYVGLQKAQSGIKTLYDTQNNILDIILTEKKSICDNNNIKLIVNIDFSICDFIETADICNIFSNMVEHSIESCNKVKGKSIHKKIKISGKVVNNFFVIKCVNTIDHLKLVNNTNTDEIDFYEDVGMNSIKLSLKKYSGEVVITSEKELVKTILLPLVKNCTDFKPETN
jgi:hypothetical protein